VEHMLATWTKTLPHVMNVSSSPRLLDRFLEPSRRRRSAPRKPLYQ
jgi:hypothetical protein